MSKGNKLKNSQMLIAILPIVALIVLFIVFCTVVQMNEYRLDMYLKIVFNEAVVLAVVATGAIFKFYWIIVDLQFQLHWELQCTTRQKDLC